MASHYKKLGRLVNQTEFFRVYVSFLIGGRRKRCGLARTKLISHQDLVVTNQIAEWRELRNNGVLRPIRLRNRVNCVIM